MSQIWRKSGHNWKKLKNCRPRITLAWFLRTFKGMATMTTTKTILQGTHRADARAIGMMHNMQKWRLILRRFSLVSVAVSWIFQSLLQRRIMTRRTATSCNSTQIKCSSWQCLVFVESIEQLVMMVVVFIRLFQRTTVEYLRTCWQRWQRMLDLRPLLRQRRRNLLRPVVTSRKFKPKSKRRCKAPSY